MVSSHGGVRGMPGIAAYSAAKGALERWAESMAGEIAPFGLGVTVLVAGMYDTDIITDAGTTDDRDFDGPYARLHTHDEQARAVRHAHCQPAREVRRRPRSRRWTTRAPSAGIGVGPDASMLLAVQSVCCRFAAMHHMSRWSMGIPRQGAMRDGACPLTASQRAMVSGREGRSRTGDAANRAADHAVSAGAKADRHSKRARTMAEAKAVRSADADRRQARRRGGGHVHQHQPRERRGSRGGRRRVEGRHEPGDRRGPPVLRRNRLVDQPPASQAVPRTTARGDRGRTRGAARGTHLARWVHRAR